MSKSFVPKYTWLRMYFLPIYHRDQLKTLIPSTIIIIIVAVWSLDFALVVTLIILNYIMLMMIMPTRAPYVLTLPLPLAGRVEAILDRTPVLAKASDSTWVVRAPTWLRSRADKIELDRRPDKLVVEGRYCDLRALNNALRAQTTQ